MAVLLLRGEKDQPISSFLIPTAIPLKVHSTSIHASRLASSLLPLPSLRSARAPVTTRLSRTPASG